MVKLPWGGDDGDAAVGEPTDEHPDAVLVCEFQDGTLVVYEDRVVIERVERSKFDDRTIPADEITGVDHEPGITVGYFQIEQTGVPVDSGGMLSDPVNQNTLHFTRSGRECAKQARDVILERARG